MATKHSVNPNFRDGYNGRLVLDRYDFAKHVNGTANRHGASSIDISGNLNYIGSPSNAQDAFSNINTYIGGQSNSGQGLITVGDGYDTWHNANLPGAQVFFDKNIPALNTLLNPIFNAILTNSQVPTAYTRIQRGGIVVIKSGTYIVTDTIVVPPGITIMGEGYGTKIINATSLNLVVSPPQVNNSTTTKSVFKVKADTNRGVNDAAITPEYFAFSRQTKICNLVICDNFVENTQVGDAYYKLPQNNYSNSYIRNNPLISQESGSNLIVDSVYLLGRVVFSSGKIVSNATQYAIGLDSTTYSSTGTMLQITNSTIDGFCQPVLFPTPASSKDFLEISNSKIRGFGYTQNDGVSIANNALISANACDIRIINNHFWGYQINANTLLYLSNIDSSITDAQSRCKIIITSNNVVIDKNSTGSPSLQTYYINPSYSAYSSKLSILDCWNNFQQTTTFTISNPVLLNNGLSKRTVSTSSTYYTIDSSNLDCIILVDTNLNAVTINLPIASLGREIIIKDIGGNARFNNIILHRPNNSVQIDGYQGDREISSNYASWTLTGDNNGNWWLI